MYVDLNARIFLASSFRARLLFRSLSFGLSACTIISAIKFYCYFIIYNYIQSHIKQALVHCTPPFAQRQLHVDTHTLGAKANCVFDQINLNSVVFFPRFQDTNLQKRWAEVHCKHLAYIHDRFFDSIMNLIPEFREKLSANKMKMK